MHLEGTRLKKATSRFWKTCILLDLFITKAIKIAKLTATKTTEDTNVSSWDCSIQGNNTQLRSHAVFTLEYVKQSQFYLIIYYCKFHIRILGCQVLIFFYISSLPFPIFNLSRYLKQPWTIFIFLQFIYLNILSSPQQIS